MNDRVELQPNGDSALDIRFHELVSATLSEFIIALAQVIEDASLVAVTELVPAYQCLTVCFDPLRLTCDAHGAPDLPAFQETLRKLVEETQIQPSSAQRARMLIRIPVCYDMEFATDMDTLCTYSGLTAAEIIARHTAPRYLVHMLGFTPGFLYLGGLDPMLHCPRKQRPELRVPAGSVGIGGSQTGIYPQATPGGWHIIGRTPLALFRPHQKPSFIARPLDGIQFTPISREQFAAIDPLSPPEQILLNARDAKELRR
ncbi:5-oxoprolinase subunit PxpB [Microbulbifer pacificus]|uniref:5-oxoprolinase subunit PxpB n=1 Tax=Microbulbifer pacificus TaxID=407164 RepID=UPI000CF55D8E|nr:5-oxoprolinase subunit PxpB [Microbulbifer pacificus]